MIHACKKRSVSLQLRTINTLHYITLHCPILNAFLFSEQVFQAMLMSISSCLKKRKKLVSICQILLKLMEARIAMMRCLWQLMSQTRHQNVARNEKRTKLSPRKAPRNQDQIFSTLHQTRIHLHHPGNHLSLMRINQIQVIFLCFASKIFTSCLYLCFWQFFQYDMKRVA